MAKARLDDVVVERAVGGDSSAFPVLYRALAPSVLAYLRAKGVADPEAATSEVFLAVFAKLRRITGGAEGLRRVVFSIAHARMVDDYRQRARAPHSAEYRPEDDPRIEASAEEHAQVGLSTDRVLTVISTLPPEQRDVLALRFVADLSIEQVAGIMRRSQGAVKQLQRRALIRVRAILADKEVAR